MNTIYWRMNATQGGANCAHEHGFSKGCETFAFKYIWL